ncbi:MAG: homogentisate 1,2-dioxygenase [Acidimicrobiia bacterium]
MPYYRSMGDVPRKRHTRFPRAGGGLHAEELMGEHGFAAESALLYHRHSPSAVVGAETVGEGELQLVPNRPLLPRHLRARDLEPGGDLVTGRRLLFGNDDVLVSYAAALGASELYRNVVGDELAYIEEGTGVLETSFGALDAGAGDYVVVPASTTHRWVPTGAGPLRALVAEARGHVRPPGRYLTPEGQFREGAPYCERDLRAPDGPLLADGTDVTVLARHRGGLTRYTYARHPFDVVGWDGCLYPYAFNIADFEPIVGRLHQPPPVHQTFEGPNFVVCSFVPRPFDFHPDAVPVPYHHANVDSDEMLFYVGGDFMSRKGSGIGPGSISLHPAGFVHGPQPGSVEAALGQPGTAETAVMIDTFRPLQLGPAAAQVADDSYPWSWARPR